MKKAALHRLGCRGSGGAPPDGRSGSAAEVAWNNVLHIASYASFTIPNPQEYHALSIHIPHLYHALLRPRIEDVALHRQLRTKQQPLRLARVTLTISIFGKGVVLGDTSLLYPFYLSYLFPETDRPKPMRSLCNTDRLLFKVG